MDTLSQILQTIRARSPLIADLSFGNNVSLGLPSLGGLPFHYVVKGNCRLENRRGFRGAGGGGLRDGGAAALLPLRDAAVAPSASRVMDFAGADSFSGR